MPNLFEHFPREVDMRTRKVVKNRKELQRFINSMNGKDNITTTVYGFRELKPNGTRGEYNTAIIPHFVIDMDRNRAEEKLGMSPEEAGNRCSEEAWRLTSHLLSKKIKHATWFSGGGFHIWVMLDKEYALPPAELNDLLFSGRAMINKWVHDMDLITLDPVVSFRPDRHIRIPNSYNFKRNLWCIPIYPGTLGEDWSFLEQLAQTPTPGFYLVGDKGLEIEIVKRDPSNPFHRSGSGMGKFDAEEIRVEMGRVQNIPILPCLEASTCEKGSNPPHHPRSYLMMYLMDFFRQFSRPPHDAKVKNDEVITKTHAFIASLEWADYNPTITQRMLEHGANRYYQSPTCPTLYREGLCVGRCPYYDGKGI